MNREEEVQIGEWNTLRKGVFERQSTFPDGKTLSERKFIDGIIKFRSIEEYPGVKRVIRETNASYLLSIGATDSLIETYSTPIEVTFDRGDIFKSVYFKDDGTTHLLIDFDEDGVNWPGRKTSPFIYASYDEGGILGSVSVKTDRVSDDPLPDFGNAQDALSSLLSYIQFDDETEVRNDDPTLLDELERFSQNPNLVIAYEALAGIVFSNVLSLISDPEEREKAYEMLTRIRLEREIFAALIIGADPTAPISTKLFDEVYSGEFAKSILTELVTQRQADAKIDSFRRVVIKNFDPELLYEEIDYEIGERRPSDLGVSSGLVKWGQGVVSQDVELRIEKEGNDVRLQWVRRGRVELSAVVPFQVPLDAHASANDPAADFRVIENLIPASLQKLAA